MQIIDYNQMQRDVVNLVLVLLLEVVFLKLYNIFSKK